jgi:hypothetical protein
MTEIEVKSFAGNPDHAWKTLTLVIDWIKQAETKSAAALAAAGVVGGVLYNLVKEQRDPSWPLALASILTAVGVIVAGVCAGAAFWPRLRHREEPSSPLFFHHIARRHASPSEYIAELSALTALPETLGKEIAEQIFWNSKVAHRKYQCASLAIKALLVGLVGLTWLVLIFGYRSLDS